MCLSAAHNRLSVTFDFARALTWAMESWLTANFPVKVVRDASKGRCLVAARDLSPGSIVLVCNSAALAPTALQARCSCCLQVPADKLLRCSNCKQKMYCCSQCQKDDWLEHKAECKHLASIAGLQPEDQTKLLLLCRLQTGRFLRQPDAQMAGRLYSHTAEDCMTMEPPTFPSGSPEAAMFDLQKRGYESLVSQAIQHGLLRAEEDKGRLFTHEGLVRLMLGFDANNFFTFDELMTGRAASVYPAAAILNHSCVPNCALWYASAAEAQANVAGRTFTAEERRGLTPPQQTPRVMVIRTLTTVRAGEELCHAYTDAAVTRDQRQAHLRSAYGFTCTCAACTAPDGSAFATERFQLATADGRRVAAVGVPTPYSPPTEGAGSGGAAPGGPFHQSNPDHSLHDDWSTLEDKEVATVKKAREALNLFKQVPLLCAKGAQGRPALEAAVTKLHRIKTEIQAQHGHLLPTTDAGIKEKDDLMFYDNLLIMHSEQSGRFELGEAGFELIGVRCLEWCLLALRTILHPLHVQVMQIINELHGSYMIFQDYQALSAATEHILASQRHCYGVHAGEGGGRVHPMVSLQLHQHADVLAELLDWATPGGAPASMVDKTTKKLLAVPAERAALLQSLYVRYTPPASLSSSSTMEPAAPPSTVPYVYVAPIEALQRTASVESIEHFGSRCAAAYEEISAITCVCQGADSDTRVETAEKAVWIRLKVQRITATVDGDKDVLR